MGSRLPVKMEQDVTYRRQGIVKKVIPTDMEQSGFLRFATTSCNIDLTSEISAGKRSFCLITSRSYKYYNNDAFGHRLLVSLIVIIALKVLPR